MRRLSIITVLGIFFSISVNAQKGTSFIGINGGLSLPMGNWGKSAFISSTNGFVYDPAGFADKGGFIGVDGAWFFSKHFGIGGLFQYGTYKTKDINTLSQGYQDSFDVDSVATTASSYTLWRLMPGLYYNLPIWKKLSLTARALVGIAHTQTPRISVTVTDSDIDDGTLVQQSASKTALGLDGGIGLGYTVTKCLAINLRGDYSYTKPSFSIQNTQRSNAAGRYVDHYDQPLSSINLSLGVAYVLGGK